MVIHQVAKPFPEFKWRWAVTTPSESLNHPRVFLGVLRAMGAFEGRKPSDPAFNTQLSKVQTDIRPIIGTELHLVRDNNRNLLRNSQQYWKALGVLKTTQGGITLTKLGRAISDGHITTEEFAAATVKTFQLPNKGIEIADVIKKWDAAKLSINPLSLILKILLEINSNYGLDSAYLTPSELIKLIIPLSAIRASPPDIAESLNEYRINPGAFTLPDCAPGANDPRMAREFLLFLAHYRFLEQAPAPTNLSEKYKVRAEDLPLLQQLIAYTPTAIEIQGVADELTRREIVGTAERSRIQVSVLSRPQQTIFRRDVLRSCKNMCVITGEAVPTVLRACHIIEVKDGGPDVAPNGIALRSDLHDLFDAGHLRISPDGKIYLSDVAEKSPTYSTLPKKIVVPKYIDKEALRKRFEYF